MHVLAFQLLWEYALFFVAIDFTFQLNKYSYGRTVLPILFSTILSLFLGATYLSVSPSLFTSDPR